MYEDSDDVMFTSYLQEDCTQVMCGHPPFFSMRTPHRGQGRVVRCLSFLASTSASLPVSRNPPFSSHLATSSQVAGE